MKPARRLPASPPQLLPSNCGTSLGNDDPAKLNYLVECSNGPDTDTGPADCDWWTLPAKPPAPPSDGPQDEDDD